MAALISSETGSGTYIPQQMMSLYATTAPARSGSTATAATTLAHRPGYITEMAYYDFHDTATAQVNSICAENLEAAC